MTETMISIPDSLYHGVQALVAKEAMSFDQFVALALGEKLSALMTEDYLGQRAQRGQRDKFLAVLDAAADVEPILGDEL
jgi:hypothetical protein